jgi:hypothetical protein
MFASEAMFPLRTSTQTSCHRPQMWCLFNVGPSHDLLRKLMRLLAKRGCPVFCGRPSTGECPAFVGAPPPGRWVVVCEASSRRGRRSYGDMHVFCPRGCPVFYGSPVTGECPPFVGAPPSGRWVVVCEASSRRGRRSYREGLSFAPTRDALHLWEPRPRGDGGWFARLFATRASLLQKR